MTEFAGSFEGRLFRRTRRSSTINVGGKRIRLGVEGILLIRLMDDILSELNHRQTTTWLIRYRPRIQRILLNTPRGLLTYLIAKSERPETLCLALWLRGRCRGTYGTRQIARLSIHNDRRVRKQVVKALRQMHGWAQLRRIHEFENDSQIRRLAQQPPIEDFQSRQARFRRNVERRQVGAVTQPLVLRAPVGPTSGKPPKPVELIRQLLMRINKLVHGHALKNTG